jgi:hypothetical protein
MPWEGECNRCGLCCTRLIEGRPTRCEHLQIVSNEEALCAKHGERSPAMPIALLDNEGRIVRWSYCTPTYPHNHATGDVRVPSKCGFEWVEPLSSNRHPRSKPADGLE